MKSDKTEEVARRTQAAADSLDQHEARLKNLGLCVICDMGPRACAWDRTHNFTTREDLVHRLYESWRLREPDWEAVRLANMVLRKEGCDTL